VSGKLFQPPAKIVQLFLIAESHGFDPSLGGNWGIFVNNDPPSSNNFIVVSDTTPIGQGRTHVDGLYRSHYGLQIKCVSQSVESAYNKVENIKEEFEKTLRAIVASPTGHSYLIQSINTESGPISLGRYDSEHILFGYSLNVTCPIKTTIFP